MNKKHLVTGGLLVLTFIIGFYIFNLLPLIKVVGGVSPFSAPDSVRWCSLNYWYCYSDFGDPAIPNFLKSQFLALFLLPIVLPTLFSFLFFKLTKRKEPIAVVLVIPAVILAMVAGYFALQFAVDRVHRPGVLQQLTPRPTPTTSQVPSEDTLIKQLLSSWATTQSKFSSKAGESGTYNQPSKVQFIAKDTFLVYYDDGLVDHISILQFKNGIFVELKNVGVMSTMPLNQWQTLVKTYGDQNFSVSNYATDILRNGKQVSYTELTKVPENVFVR